jgi:hypothetical protein
MTFRKTIAAAAIGMAALSANAANVLVVLSDESQLALRDKRSFDTGFYANELMQPVKKLLDAGHTVTFATPLGKAPTVDRTRSTKCTSAMTKPACSSTWPCWTSCRSPR